MDRNRLLMLGGAIAAAIVVVVVLVAFIGGGGGSKSPTTATATNASGGGTEATDAFAGTPQSGDTLGKASAPLALYVFEDPQCPYCRQWNIDTLPTVVQNYVRGGRVKLVYRGIPIISQNSIAGIRAVYAAGMQDKLWQMAEALYERQGEERSGWITIDVIKEAAREVGANPEKLLTDADSDTVTAKLKEAEQLANQYGINSTPSFGYQKQLGTLQPLQISGLEPADFTPGLDAALR
ncbi:MAG TPA: thioredoxin domain-containing protein [Gaiellaceae bacterium]|nr:thioredoxin domain-containing protein [Gaiellaceae bacterium]